MKMANPGKDQIDAVYFFLRMLEGVIENRIFPGDDEREVDTDDPAATIRFIEEQWTTVELCWQRVLMAGQTCLENACDPNARTLEFKPEIARAIEEYPRLKAEHGELLAALQNLLMQIERAGGEPSFGVSHLREARTAISKAKGPTP